MWVQKLTLILVSQLNIKRNRWENKIVKVFFGSIVYVSSKTTIFHSFNAMNANITVAE